MKSRVAHRGGNTPSVFLHDSPRVVDVDPPTMLGAGRVNAGMPLVMRMVDNEQQPTRTSGVGTVTVGGSPSGGDTVSITLMGITVSYVIQTAETVTDAAAALVALLNANDHFYRKFTFKNVAGVVHITHAGGAMGEIVELTASKDGAVTISASASTLSGGTGPIAALRTFSFNHRNRVITFMEGKMYTVDASLLAALYASPEARENVG